MRHNRLVKYTVCWILLNRICWWSHPCFVCEIAFAVVKSSCVLPLLLVRFLFLHFNLVGSLCHSALLMKSWFCFTESRSLLTKKKLLQNYWNPIKSQLQIHDFPIKSPFCPRKFRFPRVPGQVAPVRGYGVTVELPVAKATVVMRKAEADWEVS